MSSFRPTENSFFVVKVFDVRWIMYAKLNGSKCFSVIHIWNIYIFCTKIYFVIYVRTCLKMCLFVNTYTWIYQIWDWKRCKWIISLSEMEINAGNKLCILIKWRIIKESTVVCYSSAFLESKFNDYSERQFTVDFLNI